MKYFLAKGNRKPEELNLQGQSDLLKSDLSVNDSAYFVKSDSI